MTTPRNPFLDLLEERPDIGYQGFLKDQGFKRSKKDFLRNRFSDVQNRYFSELGSQARQGEAPNKRFDDFLSNFNFDEFYGSFSPSSKGRTRGNLLGRTRWLTRF